jgi:putative endonuclease
MAKHNEIGRIGEELSRTFLMKQGFSILETNYRTRYGEVDIVAQKDSKIRFVEVKTIKVRGADNLKSLLVRPEDHLTREKWRHITICAEAYLKNRNVPHVTLWQMDLACVYLDVEKKEGRVVLMENIHKE